MVESPCVGERLCVKDKSGQHFACVRYVGRIDGRTGVWVGVEWDDAARGKHDGVVDGIRYFTCRQHASAASFLKVDKVKAGVSLVNAVHARYTFEDVQLADMTIETAGHRSLEVVLAGKAQIADRLRKVSQLDAMTFHDARIARAGDANRLTALLPRVRYLCLSGNLLGSWTEVHHIVAALPACQTLDVSFNRLEGGTDAASLDSCAHLEILICNGCGATWSDLVNVVAAYPALTELYAAGNTIQACNFDNAGCRGSSAGTLARLRVLDVMQNQITSWKALEACGTLPELQQLKVSGNNLGECVPEFGLAFKRLEVLLAASCHICDWATVEALAACSSLFDLRISENPVLQFSAIGGRVEAIARVGGIRVLNGAAVSRHERRDSELHYLRHVMQRVSDLGGASGVRGARELDQHPRVPMLIDMYGDVDLQPSRDRAGSGACLAAQLLDVCVVAEDSSDKDPTHLCLPGSTSIGHLKMLCEAILGVDVNLQCLTLRSGSRAGEVVSHDNSLDIAHWGLDAGEVLSVSRMSPDAAWRRMLGQGHDSAVPSHWLLPPELRPELANIAQQGP